MTGVISRRWLLPLVGNGNVYRRSQSLDPRFSRSLPLKVIDERRLARSKRVVFSYRPRFDAPIGMNAHAYEMLEPGVRQDAERLLVLEAEHSDRREKKANPEGSEERIDDEHSDIP